MLDRRPNILFITTHDTGRHFGCYGIETIRSPAIDALAADGVRFTNCFCSAPKCSPSRAAMMTGRWPQSNGVMGLTHSPHLWKYKEGERHLSQILRDAGYDTHFFHFQHEALDIEKLGFQHYHAMPAPIPHDDGGKPEYFRPASEVADAFAGFCDAYDGEQPFYAQVGFFETHGPLGFGGNTGDDAKGVTVLSQYADNAENREFFRMLQGSVRQADAAVGVMLEALDRNGLRDNTLVVFTVDHGISITRAKGTLYDLGLEVALIMRWPKGGISGGRTCDRLTSNIDVFPTILELIDVPVPGNVEGVGFAASLSGGEGKDAGRQYVFGEIQEKLVSRCIRSRRFKLIRHFAGYRPYSVPVDRSEFLHITGPFVEMFDLNADPLEVNNIAEDPRYAEDRAKLDRALYDHLRRVGDPILQGPVPMPYYRHAMDDFKTAVHTSS